jgi:hypothetical protein
MPKGITWSIEEEHRLKELSKKAKSLLEISQTTGRSVMSIKAKMYDLNIRLERSESNEKSAQPFELTADLPSIEEKLKVLNAALKALETPGLSTGEVLRLRTIVQGTKSYQDMFAKYCNYEAVEHEMQEIRAKLEEQNKSKQ